MMEGVWLFLRSWLRSHHGISQEKLPFYLAFLNLFITSASGARRFCLLSCNSCSYRLQRASLDADRSSDGHLKARRTEVTVTVHLMAGSCVLVWDSDSHQPHHALQHRGGELTAGALRLAQFAFERGAAGEAFVQVGDDAF